MMIPSAAFFILAFTALVSAVVSILLWRHRHLAGGVPLALLMAAVTLWSFVAAMEAGASTLEGKILWSKLEYLGSGSTVTLYLFFALQRAGINARIGSRHTLALWLLPIVNLALAMTNEWHGKLWTGFSASPIGNNQIVYHHGPVFFGLLACMYVYALVGSTMLIRNATRGGLLRSRQNYVVLAASIMPLLGGVLYAFHPAWLGGINITPMTFGVTGLVFAVGVVGLRYFDIAPVARNTLFEAMDDGVLVLDAENRVADLNPAASKILGVAPTCVGQPAEIILARWPALIEGCRRAEASHSEIHLSENPLRAIDARLTPVYERDQLWSGLILVFRDITARVQAQRALQEAHDQLQDQILEVTRLQEAVREQAIHDALTGLFNRRYLQETLPREMASSKRHARPLSVILIDVDRFKSVNDSLGHHIGDRVLRQLAQMLDETTREGDIACRYGGDEFVLVLPDTALDDALEKAETIRRNCHSRCHAGAQQDLPAVSLSLGVASFPDHGDNVEKILVAADRALYRAKRSGRDQVQAG